MVRLPPFKFVIGVFQNVIVEMQKSLFRFVTVRWLELWKKSFIQLSYFRVAFAATSGRHSKSLHLAKWSFVSHVITRLWQKGRQYFVVTFWGVGGTTKINTLVRVKKRECDSHTDWTQNCINFSGKRKKVSQRATDIFLAAKINKIKLKVKTQIRKCWAEKQTW